MICLAEQSLQPNGSLSVSAESLTLNDLLLQYAMSRDISAGYLSSLTRTVKRAANAGLRYVHQMDDVQVNRFLASLSTSVSKVTQSNIRREFLTLWNYAIQENLTDTIPLRVRKIRVTQQPVEAWSHEELQQMLAAASDDDTNCGGVAQVKLNTWMPHWITLGYETALRFSDIHNLRQSNVRRGSVCCTAHKTGKPLVRPLTEQALSYANELISRSSDGSLFTWMLTRRRAFVSWKNFWSVINSGEAASGCGVAVLPTSN